MASLSDRGLPAVLGRLAICANADSQGCIGGLCAHCGLEPDLFVFAVGRRAFRCATTHPLAKMNDQEILAILSDIIERLERIEARQIAVREEIKESA